jgi:hypothetical protein
VEHTFYILLCIQTNHMNLYFLNIWWKPQTPLGVLLLILFGSLYATPGQALLQFPMLSCHELPFTSMLCPVPTKEPNQKARSKFKLNRSWWWKFPSRIR